MKKILLAFVGMVFFAHLSYATYYRIIRSDHGGENQTNDYANTSYDWTEMRNAHVKAPYNKTCWNGGGSGASDDREKIYCDIGSMSPSHFWSKARCDAYADEVYKQNTVSAECELGENGSSAGDGRHVYKIKSPYGWGWDADKGVYVHDLYVEEWAGPDSNSKNKEWTGTKDYMMDLTKTILTTDAFASVMSSFPVPCHDYYGNNISGKNVTCKKVTNDTVRCFRTNCPTMYNNKAFVEYYAKKKCQESLSRNSATATGCPSSADFTTPRWFYVDTNDRFYKNKTDRWGDTTDRQYTSTSYMLKCKNYYNKWVGDRIDGRCAGTYRIEYTDPSEDVADNPLDVRAFTEHDGRITYDVTQAEVEEVQHFPEATRGRVSCSKVQNAGHDGLPGSEKVVCRCASHSAWRQDLATGGNVTPNVKDDVQTFWSSGNCQLYRKKNGLEKSTYCHHNKGVQGVCSWELLTAVNPVSTCAGTSSGTAYLTKEDSGRACVKHHNN